MSNHHTRDCAYVTSDGPAPCTCGWWEREEAQRLGGPGKIFTGIHANGDYSVWVRDGERHERLNPRLDLRNHSPSGLSWGYGGSGPAQTALAILVEVLGPHRAQRRYQPFKWQVISKLPQRAGWSMNAERVREWHRKYLREHAQKGWRA